MRPPGSSVVLPFCLFTLSLTVLLLISWVVVLPQFTRFEVSDRALAPTEIVAYQMTLEGDIRVAERKRDALLMPVHDPAYTALRGERARRPSFDSVRQELQARAALIAGPGDVVTFRAVDMDLRTGVVRVEGEVSTIGPRSMTLLARFVEELRDSSLVASLIPPAFVREEGPKGSFRSPFSFEFTLHTSADTGS